MYFSSSSNLLLSPCWVAFESVGSVGAAVVFGFVWSIGKGPGRSGARILEGVRLSLDLAEELRGVLFRG